MSLDVYLTLSGASIKKAQTIYIRDDGQTRAITRAEWDARYPDQVPYAVEETTTDHVFTANITHNLNTMAEAAGLYAVLWRPDEHAITTARQLIVPLAQGLVQLQTAPDLYRIHNPANGWGCYDTLVRFVEAYLVACIQWPEANVSVWR